MAAGIRRSAGATLVAWFLLASRALAADTAGSPLDSLRLLNGRAEYAAAENGARALLARLEAARGTDSLEIVATLDVLVKSLLEGGKAGEPECRRLAERAVAMGERAAGPEDPSVAFSLNALGAVLDRLRDPEAAATMHRRALAIREKAFGPEDPVVAESLTNLGAALTGTGNDAQALELYERGLAIREKALPPDDPDLAVTRHNLAEMLAARAEFTRARSLFELSLPVFEKSPTLAVHVPSFLVSLGRVLDELGATSESSVLFDRAIAIAEQRLTENDLSLAETLLGCGNHFWHRGEYAKARRLLERSQAIREKLLAPDDPGVALGLTSLGVVAMATYDHATSRRYYEKALAIYEKALGPDHFIVAIVAGNLGHEVMESGDLATARALWERGLAINEKTFGPRNPRVASDLTNLAKVQIRLGDFAATRALSERAISIREEAFGPRHHEVAFATGLLANLYSYMGNDSAARPLYERAISILAEVQGRDHPRVGFQRDRLARLLARQGDFTAAMNGALEAGRIARDNMQANGASVSEREALRLAGNLRWGHDLSLTLLSRGLASESQRRAYDAMVRSRAVVLDVMAERHRLAGGSADPRVAALAANLAVTRERLSTLAVRGAGRMKPEVYRPLVDSLRIEKEKAEHELAEASLSFARGLTRQRAGLDEVVAELPAGSALVSVVQYSRLDFAPRTPLPAGVPAPALTGGSGVPDAGIATTDTAAYLAFVLRAGEREPQVIDLGPAQAIDHLVERWKEDASGRWLRAGMSTERAEAAYRASGGALRRAVWDRLLPALGDAARIFVVPDGTLNLVNLAALPAEAGGYLVEQGPIVHLLSAERDLVRGVPAPHGGSLLALGAPDYESTLPGAAPGDSIVVVVAAGVESSAPPVAAYRGPRSGCADFSTARFEPLPATGDEVAAIVRLWEKSVRPRSKARASELRGAGASESALKRAVSGCRVLHLATHGFFLGGDCESAWKPGRGIGSLGSAADSSADQAARWVDSQPQVRGENPLLLSGLVLAGANRRAAAGEGADDGILTAEEVASLDLTGVEWAVLSACETGVGDVRSGEGVFGLRRAFQAAGASTLIMSLWSVEDEATRSWMKALYQGRLGKQMATAEAVRNASLTVLRERRKQRLPTHPFYWAAFVATGDWR